MTTKTYTIRTVADFATVPPDRLEACLEEFKEFVGMFQKVAAFMRCCGETVDSGVRFAWTDDGKRDAGIVIVTKQEGKT